MKLEKPEYIQIIHQHGENYFSHYIKDHAHKQKDLDLALRWASFFSDLKTVQILVENKADVFVNDNEPFINSIGSGKNDIVRYLSGFGAHKIENDHNIGGHPGEAAFNGNLEALKFLIDDLKLDWRKDNDGAFRYSCYGGHLECAQFLYEKGVNIHAENNWAFIHSCENNRFEIVKFLFSKSNDFLAVGDRALGFASEKGSMELIKFLTSKRIKPLNDSMVSAIISKRYDLIDYFISLGGDIHASNDYILRVAHEDLFRVEFCLKHGMTQDYIISKSDEKVKYYFNKKNMEKIMPEKTDNQSQIKI